MNATVLEETISLNVNTFKIHLKQNGTFNGKVNWLNYNGIPSSTLSYSLNTNERFIELSYVVYGGSYCYKVGLERLPSNLGKGWLWYFICPSTNKRCRKLHFINSYFFHRTAFEGVYYEDQIDSKAYRTSNQKHIRNQFKIYDLLGKMLVPYYKEYYNGKPTKRTLSYLKRIQKLSGKYSE